mgnify:CR=1 FL=1
MSNSQEENVLTLTPDAVIEVPSLTLEPEKEAALIQAGAAAPLQTKPEVEPVVLDERILSAEEQQMVRSFAEKIDIQNANQILQYGAAAQKKIAGFSEAALTSVRTKDLGEVGNVIADLVVELKGFDVDDEDKGFFGFFKKATNKVAAMKAKYDRAEVNVDKICNVLENHQIQLLKDIAMLDKMYDMNLGYLKELAMYIIAGKQKLEQVRATILPELSAKAKASGLPEDAQAANDLANLCDRFEKKIYDLELTRMVSIQMSPQIRLIQNNDTLMAEKIQSSLVNTIPLWKSQMVLALGLAHSKEAMEAQREVSNVTNELLRENAEKLKMGTIETAKEAERGIVDIETLKKTNQDLITTLDEVVRIQEEGRQKRRLAEQELGRIEGELKQKLLDIRG